MKVLEHKCIGCGRCAHDYPEIFKMVNGKAKVISKKYQRRAIKICPAEAIKK